MARIILIQISVFLNFSFGCLFGQSEDSIHYSHRFTEKLKSLSLDFLEPVEGYYKVKPLISDDYFTYDLVIESREKQFEMRYILRKDFAGLIPQMECFNTVNHVAVNDDRFDIRMNIMDETDLTQQYHADWGAWVDFIPKRSFSDKYFGRVLTLFKADFGIVHAILLFNRQDAEKDIRLQTFSFRENF